MVSEYGQIFTHLVFYVDTPQNAKKNELKSSEPSAETTQR